ncbi:MAG TPA: hypothetical protein PK941_10790 [Paludibacter sp.]|nr:hypothetical protein [Paludibacter sp.]
MDKQNPMYVEVESWLASGKSKKDFIAGKPYNMHKFEYWYRKYQAQKTTHESNNNDIFKEITYIPVDIPIDRTKVVLEIESPGGIKIRVFQ